MELNEIISLSLLAVFIIVLIARMVIEKEFDVRSWLLSAVILAEKEFGSGTGSEKLKTVYEKFIAYFPIFSLFVSFDTFSRWVDISLDYMREALAEEEED